MGAVRQMLTLEDLEEISWGITENLTGRQIAVRIGRCPSMVGKNCASAVSTLVERTSRYLILAPLNSRDSATVTASVADQIKGLPDTLRRTLTWDCGAEMARHAALSVAADIDVYFARPHSLWERGTNENTNRWLREYFPKGTTIPSDPDYLQAVADELNDRPRRILGWRSQMKSSPSYSPAALLPPAEGGLLSRWI